ncbi:MAG TPA: penicillin-binding transpeptidase domain-containing protein [Gammaproteobacteria bacterium]|nr:penicillin-binding transpeptidase domain-containing protein [Gammaproteobacteria bacterium]
MRNRQTLIDAQRASWRGTLLLVCFALGAATLEGRILYLQLVNKDFLTAQADDRHLRTVQISAHRGVITDRNGEPLAVSTPVDSVWANPQELKPALDRLHELAGVLGQDDEWLARRLTSNLDREFVYLQRHLPPSKSEQVLQLGLPGVGTLREYRRYYPAGEVVGHVVGFTDVDDAGQEGLELAFNHWLKGENGSKRVRQDRLGRVINDVELISAAKPGRDLRTSLDLRLQYLAYRELKVAVTESRARSGSAVILDSASGEVLAMVNQPSFNPNDRSQLDVARYRNRALTDIFEPGSSFKPFVLGAALESGEYHADTVIDTAPGFLRVNGRIVTEDNSNLGRIDVTTVLAKSSNVGMAQIALKMEPFDVWQVLSGFGIGRLTDSGFPGESAGVLNDPQHWRAVGQATISYGYGLSVTTLQLARAYAAIAAGGVLRPISMLAVDAPPPGERVISEASARALIGMLEAVVASSEGTGQRAAVRNYRVAGKTGTAWKSAVGGYSKDRYTAVFAGLAPASAPQLVVVVVIDEPQGQVYYGGDIAAPVFANIVSGALRVLAVPPDALPALPLTVVAQARVNP